MASQTSVNSVNKRLNNYFFGVGKVHVYPLPYHVHLEHWLDAHGVGIDESEQPQVHTGGRELLWVLLRGKSVQCAGGINDFDLADEIRQSPCVRAGAMLIDYTKKKKIIDYEQKNGPRPLGADSLGFLLLCLWSGAMAHCSQMRVVVSVRPLELATMNLWLRPHAVPSTAMKRGNALEKINLRIQGTRFLRIEPMHKAHHKTEGWSVPNFSTKINSWE